MILAKVVGHVVATQKCDELRGSNLLLIVKLDDDQQPMKDQTWV
ncbi:ethanolamine utilization protein EutN, partial [Klebsiella michiganensis]